MSQAASRCFAFNRPSALGSFTPAREKFEHQRSIGIGGLSASISATRTSSKRRVRKGASAYLSSIGRDEAVENGEPLPGASTHKARLSW